MIYVPEGFAQGYITLADNTEIYYHTSEFYNPESAFGVRYDDPEFGIVGRSISRLFPSRIENGRIIQAKASFNVYEGG